MTEAWHNLLFWLLAAAACGSALAVVITQNIVRMAFWLLISLAAVGGLFFLLGADFVGSAQLMVYVGGTLVLLIFGVMLTASGPFVSLRTGARDWVLAAVVGSTLLALVVASVGSRGVEWAGAVNRSFQLAGGATQRVAIGLKADTLTSFDLRSDHPVTIQTSGASVELTPKAPLTWASTPEPTSTALGLALLGVRNANGPRGAAGTEVSIEPSAADQLRAADLRELTVTNRSGTTAHVELRFSATDVAESPSASSAARAGYLLPFEIASVHLLVVLIGAAYLARAKRRSGGGSIPT